MADVPISGLPEGTLSDTSQIPVNNGGTTQRVSMTAVGAGLAVAADQVAARNAIGAGTGNSNLEIGTTGTTAMAGNAFTEITGYDPDAEQTLKNIAGTLTWVTDE